MLCTLGSQCIDVPGEIEWSETADRGRFFCTSRAGAMRTLALHTLSTHTAHYTAVTSRETRGNGRLAYPHVHPSERLPDALYGPTRITFAPHCAQTAW